MTTATVFIKQALSMLGVLALGEQVDGDTATDALPILNGLLDSWSLDSLYVFTIQEIVQAVAGGTQSLTIGPGANINIARPYQVEDGAFFRVGTVDYQMEKIDRVRYEGIAVKSVQTSYPRYYYYDQNFPVGTVSFWMALSGPAELHLPVVTQLTQFADLTTDYAFPPGYVRLIGTGLAVELAPNYRPASAELLRNFASASRNVRKINARIPTLSTPGIPGAERLGVNSRFNVIAGY